VLRQISHKRDRKIQGEKHKTGLQVSFGGGCKKRWRSASIKKPELQQKVVKRKGCSGQEKRAILEALRGGKRKP